MNPFRILAGALTLLVLSTSLALAVSGASGHSHRSFGAGAPGDPKKPARTVEVVMKETDDGKMLFVPDRVEAKRGEQVRFVLKNAGKVDHEFLLDTPERNAKHKVEMRKNPDMEHDDPNGKRLAPGGTGEIVWRFSKPGTFEFACLIPGHHESGMHGKAIVK
jgi:uncharacterized cupredoxin-like copper-binding protein